MIFMRQYMKFHPSALHQATQFAHTIVEKINAEKISFLLINKFFFNKAIAWCCWNYCSLFVNFAGVC